MDDVVTVGTFVVLSTARYYDENFPLVRARLLACFHGRPPIATICAARTRLKLILMQGYATAWTVKSEISFRFLHTAPVEG